MHWHLITSLQAGLINTSTTKSIGSDVTEYAEYDCYLNFLTTACISFFDCVLPDNLLAYLCKFVSGPQDKAQVKHSWFFHKQLK